jgi:predicted outer membrane repeat protein
MNSHPPSPSNSDLTLKITRALLSEATRRPWLATLLLHRTRWLAELAQRLSRFSRQVRRQFHRALAAGLSVMAVLAAAFLWTSPAYAGTITVDGTTCTLSNAITSANNDSATGGCAAGSGADTINLTTDVTLTSVLPNITSDITIEGNEHTIQRNSGSSNFRILFVGAGGSLTLKQATITGGVDSDGGGIYVSEETTLIVENCTISGNTATTSGGAIFNGSVIILTNSTISGNQASKWGGAIYSTHSALTVQNSTISGNSATQMGGGIMSFYDTAITIENSTITGNTAVSGAGIFDYDSNDFNTRFIVKNSIIALQTSGDDCGYLNMTATPPFTSQGYNIESSSSCSFMSTGDQNNVNSTSLNLGSLADNGGDTQTIALGSGSAAIDQIPDEINDCDSGVSTDQRNAVRADGTNRGGTACDIGAYEANSTQTPTAVTLRTLAGSAGSPVGVMAAFVAAAIASGAGWFKWKWEKPAIR